MTADACRPWREQLGALVLDGLDADDRAAVAAHVDGCPACHAEAAKLAPVARLLGSADPARVAARPAPPAGMAERVLERIGAEGRARRRTARRRWGAALAGACAAAAVAALALTAGDDGPARPTTERVAFRGLPAGVALQARMSPHAGGTQIELRVRGVSPGTLCTVWLRDVTGARVPAGSFRYRAGYAGADQRVLLTSALSRDEAVALGVTAGRRTFLAPLPAPS